MTNNKLTEIPVTEADIQTVLDAFDYRTGIDSHAEYIVRCALAELQERRKADSVTLARNPVLAYADSYRDMAKRGVESIPVWSVITDLERNIVPLYTAPPAPIVPLSITLPDTSSKVFWSGTGKKEVFHPETYKRWAKEAIERFCMIARIAVEVK